MIGDKTAAALIVAAGASRRMGFDKLFARVGGKTVLELAVGAFDRHEMIDEIVVVAGQNAEDVRPLLERLRKPWKMVSGGAQRCDSVENGLAAVGADLVAIHDAARPFVTADVISRALRAALETGAAAPAVPVKDTVKAACGGIVVNTPPRETLFAVQTPQCFFTREYRALLKTTDKTGVTDDCSVYERAGRTVTLVEGDYANRKLTTPDDLPKEEKTMRIGHGYDVHRLTEGRRLILGGVDIPFEKGLDGHSDADVLVHAVMDALLGAAALGDIGKLFPDTDEAYRGADSLVLLGRVGEALGEAGFAPVNIDATILCQRPKLAPHIPAMRANIAARLGMETGCVSVKATTEEKLGFTGAGEGIAAHAVCLIERA